jgi:hypothetical protein
MGFGIERHAARKRGLFRRAPDPRELADRVVRLARRMFKDAVVRTSRDTVALAFHHAEAEATLAVESDGRLLLRAHTSVVGPGYHAHVLERIEPLLDELDFTWVEPYELDAMRRAMCDAVAHALRHGTRSLGVERPFVVDAPVLTPLGPRDAAWRDAVIANPMHAADCFAWWEPAAPGHAERANALLAMWSEVPWREPLDSDERALMKRVDADLRAAQRADREIELPWPEWAELLDCLGVESERAERVRERAGDRAPTIGYRRYDLELELSGGWSIHLPGSFVGSWEDEGERYWATDGERTIEFTSVTANDQQDSAHLLAVAPERHAVVDRFADGARQGRAEAYVSDDVHVVHGLVAQAPHVAILTCKGTAEDQPWALAAWRSLRNS